MEYTEAIGYGVVSTWLKAGGGSTYFLKRPLTEEEKAEVIQDLTDDSVDGEQSYAVLYDPVTKEATALFGKIPDDYSNEEG